MDIALLLLRTVVGLLFIAHGTQKLFGWFGGPGMANTAGWMGSLGYRRGRMMATAAGVTEAGGGLLLALGLFTPFAAAAIIGVMLNAIVTVHLRNGLWSSNGGGEYPLVLMAIATATALAGPGAYSADAQLGWALSGFEWMLFALALGSVSAWGILASRTSEMAAVETIRTAEEVDNDERIARGA